MLNASLHLDAAEALTWRIAEIEGNVLLHSGSVVRETMTFVTGNIMSTNGRYDYKTA